MKPLVLAALSALVFSAGVLQAQVTKETTDSLKDLKKKYAAGGQKPAAAAEAPANPDSAEMTVADLEALLLKVSGCRKNPDDTAQLSADLKGKYSLVSCHDEIEGWRQVVLVPKAVSPNRQLQYGSMVGHKLLRARLVDHYLVLQFDKQVQYLDLLKQEKDLSGKDTGFALAGFVADQSLSRFEDVGIFKDALKNYAGVAESSELQAKIADLAAKAAGGKRYRLQASKPKDSWVVIVTSDGSLIQVWPESKP